MTGVEAAGLVLAILPLIVSSVEHYDDVLRPFSRYSRFSAEVNRFQLRLKAQKVIFENECRLLLYNVTDKDSAADLLEATRCSSRVDDVLAADFARQLGRCGEACLATVEQIEQKLRDIGEEGQSLESVVNQCKSKKSRRIGGEDWRSVLRAKLRFSFSEHRHEENLASLERLNNEFLTLSAQAHRIASFENHPVKRTTSKQRWDSGKYKQIRAASEALYGALEKACTKHTEHLAHLCLDERPATSSPVQFNLAFTHLALSKAYGPETAPAWFLVESIVSEMKNETTADVPNVMVDLTKTLKRQRTPPIPSQPRNIKKSVRFRSLTPPSSNCQVASLSLIRPSSSLPQLCQRSNFCDQLRHYLQGTSPKQGSCLGVLDRNNHWEQRVYATQDNLGPKQPTSLAYVISSLMQTSSRFTFPRYQRLCIAKLLASAVLQFYSTPWLTESWRTEDILFFGLEASSKQAECLPKTPYLNVRVKTPNNQVAKPSSTVALSLVRNHFLFRLGVVLIELAYKAPLHTLQQPCDQENGRETRYSEFFAARRLGEHVDGKMGRSYGKVVRQCLECDFGRGQHDLSDPQLQESFFQDVVCELQRLEDGLRNLYLGP